MRALHPLRTAVFIGFSVLSLFGCGVEAEAELSESEEGAAPTLGVAAQGLEAGTVVTWSAGHSGMCLDLANGAQGTTLYQWPCHGGINQQFTPVAMGDGTYSLVSKVSGLCVDVPNGNWGVTLYQWPCHGGDNQRFWLRERGTGSYEIVAKHTGLCLDVSGAGYGAGTNIIQWGCHGLPNQSFRLGLSGRPQGEKNACASGLGDGKNCSPDVQVSGIVPYANCVYGFHVGAGWGSGTAAVYDEVDRCAFWHDSGCWNVNHATWVNEGNGGCSQTVNFIACVERIIPSTQEEAAARSCILNSLLAVGANICEPFGRGTFYPLYDAATTGGRCAGAWSYP
ncbi:RICIN domain-containing protein [Hyalangium gracile]|uniref:RICIN domain-containing protein n=1 Tax=Hyalangium gracile TaxID=394092 RepID=UPI001CCA6C03|nr:RICIN domain-containing protein [Hyalangium gracile]